MSGMAGSGSRVAIYINNVFVGAANADDTGAWTFSLSEVSEAGQLALRADQLHPETGKVLARAEVNFDRPELSAARTPAPAAASASAAAPERSADVRPAQPDAGASRTDGLAPTETRAAALSEEAEPPALADDERMAKPEEPGERAIVVRRGDTLWHIAERHYGSGIRYTKIFRSNRDQIRNPHRIYPEQEFILPR